MPSPDTLSLFSSLPRRVQRAIDDAFETSVSPSRPSKRRKISIEPSGGGFVAEPSSASSPADHIPLDVIPSALQRLDLPPDDEEVLSVFRNAASGWAPSESQTASNVETRYISLEDWRAVCAVLLENRPLEDGQEHLNNDELDVGNSSDEYLDGENSSEGISSAASAGSDDDEYFDGGDAPSSRRRKRRSRQAVSFDELNAQANNNNLTQRQKQSCLDTFALFFPHVSASELETQRIAIKDLQRVAKLLNEKLKADEVGKSLTSF
jgi:hypothetical protein